MEAGGVMEEGAAMDTDVIEAGVMDAGVTETGGVNVTGVDTETIVSLPAAFVIDMPTAEVTTMGVTEAGGIELGVTEAGGIELGVLEGVTTKGVSLTGVVEGGGDSTMATAEGVTLTGVIEGGGDSTTSEDTVARVTLPAASVLETTSAEVTTIGAEVAATAATWNRLAKSGKPPQASLGSPAQGIVGGACLLDFRRVATGASEGAALPQLHLSPGESQSRFSYKQ